MKEKCIAIIQKKIIMEIVFDDDSLTKLQRESEKTLVGWFWQVLAQVRLADLSQISKPDIEIPMMTSQILKSVDFTKTQKSTISHKIFETNSGFHVK